MMLHALPEIPEEVDFAAHTWPREHHQKQTENTEILISEVKRIDV